MNHCELLWTSPSSVRMSVALKMVLSCTLQQTWRLHCGFGSYGRLLSQNALMPPMLRVSSTNPKMLGWSAQRWARVFSDASEPKMQSMKPCPARSNQLWGFEIQWACASHFNMYFKKPMPEANSNSCGFLLHVLSSNLCTFFWGPNFHVFPCIVMFWNVELWECRERET